MTAELTGESIHKQPGSSRDSLCRVRALCPRFLLRKKLGSGPLLRALPRDPGRKNCVALRLTWEDCVASNFDQSARGRVSWYNIA